MEQSLIIVFGFILVSTIAFNTIDNISLLTTPNYELNGTQYHCMEGSKTNHNTKFCFIEHKLWFGLKDYFLIFEIEHNMVTKVADFSDVQVGSIITTL